MTDDTKPRLGPFDSRYFDHFVQLLRGALATPADESAWQRTDLEVGSALARHSINRRRKKRIVVSRRPRLNAFVNAPNPQGETDESIKALIARDDRGAPQFIVWNYACHPVAYPGSSAISAHFPHVVRKRLRKLFDSPELPVLYFQGFSGNTRPSASTQLHGLGRRVRRVLVGPIFSDLSWDAYDDWSNSLASVVLEAVKSATPLGESALVMKRTMVESAKFVHDAPEPFVSFQTIKFGDKFCIAGVSAEVVAEYAPTVRLLARSENVMCVGCLDHTIGYVPTAQILGEGGYEAGGYCESFSLGLVAENVEMNFIEAFRRAFGSS